MAGLAVAAPYLVGAGTVLAAGGDIAAGDKAAKSGKIQKALNDVAATQAVAVGQRKALEENRQAKLMASRAIAVAAAGGASQDIDNLIADISGEGMYRANLAMYEGETESERLKYEGLMAEQAGERKRKASRIKAVSTVLKGAVTIGAMGAAPPSTPTTTWT